ncbi:MAG: hypothetical protein PHU24_06845 [Sphaerochaetaceae bacterium]|nr:hypothetical protein [Sphaerochaetaceae bacterium]MDD2406155.1 hypothetical protein [Sphaerochaetaceae bacterium]MDD4259196.1 hypothetical protein [Sphaerochaetaceae bacterium]MDX9934546.1 hypothetical protein [Sphaerochaetaceae bacterium]NLO59675.1 hypothetical protein [Spirochaetales bacterium]
MITRLFIEYSDRQTEKDQQFHQNIRGKDYGYQDAQYFFLKIIEEAKSLFSYIPFQQKDELSQKKATNLFNTNQLP